MLSVKNISFSYSNKKTLNNINFSINEGKCVAIIGESGCGKSTLLKLIYGLYDLDAGEIFWREKEVLGPKFHLIPGMEHMKYLAQDFDLMPFITVAENIGKYLSNLNGQLKNERILELLEVVEMSEFANTKAKLLSGGQMQRVALARVIALEPEVLLLDEPFSHIDNFRKNKLRRNLFSYLKEKKITTLIATHDTTDVLPFCDDVIVLQNGKIIQKNSTSNVYSSPLTTYVASLFDDVNEIEIEGKIILVYPHQLEIVPISDIEVTTSNCYFRGNHYLIEGIYNDKFTFFLSENKIEINTKIYLKINLKNT